MDAVSNNIVTNGSKASLYIIYSMFARQQQATAANTAKSTLLRSNNNYHPGKIINTTVNRGQAGMINKITKYVQFARPSCVTHYTYSS